MVSNQDETILPSLRRTTPSGALDGDTVLPFNGTPVGHSVGDVIDDRYTVIREIGRGGMGIVYEAEDSLLGGQFSIKRLLPEHANRSEIAELFKREGANAIRFTGNSRRFVTMRHVGTDANGLYLVMDYVTDPTMRSIMNANMGQNLPLKVVMNVIVELANALADLHALGFVHRDLKPENVFVSIDGDNANVRLVDFGLTKEDVESTQTNLRGAGTNGYASPEQRKGLPTTASTDVYAFGIITYELLTGELPTAADRLSDFNVEVPVPLEDLVMDCLTAKLERRPVDGRALVQRLASVLKETGVDTADFSKQPKMVPEATILIENVQDGALVLINGDVIQSPYSIKVPLSEETSSAHVYCSWQGVVILDTIVPLEAYKAVSLRCGTAFRISTHLPNWCEAFSTDGKKVNFPISSILPNDNSLGITYRYGGKTFLTQNYKLISGENFVDFSYGLSRLVISAIPEGGTVWVDGVPAGAETIFPVSLKQPAELQVQVRSSDRNIIWSKTLYLEAGKSHEHAVMPPQLRSRPTDNLPPVVVRKPPVVSQHSASATNRVTINVLPITSMFQKGGLVHLILNKNRIASGNAADGVRISQDLSSGPYELIVERQYRAGETYGKGITTKYVIQVGSGHPTFHTVEWSSLAQNYIMVSKT